MFEYLVCWEDADGTECKKIVDFGELLAHIENALNEDDYCAEGKKPLMAFALIGF